MMKLTPLILLTLAACAPKVDVADTADPAGDTGTTDGGATDGGATDGGATDGGATDGGSTGGTTGGGTTGGTAPGAELSTAVLATVAEDYSVGALATVDLDTWSVSDSIVDISGDPVVVYSGGYLFQINRYTYDNIRVYEPGQWEAPLTEFALVDLANPHDVEVCDGLAFITQYGEPSLAVYDHETGLLAGSVDLSSYDDGDGTPEASTMVKAANGMLYAGLQRLDRNGGWVSQGGAVVEIDCASKQVTRSWDFSGSVSVYDYAPDSSRIVVYDGGDDAGLWLLDTATGELSEQKLSDMTVGASIGGFASYGDSAVVITSDDDYNYGIGCVDLSDWSYTPAEAVDNYLAGVVANARGEAWISARTHWANPAAANGAIVYDIAACSSLTAGDPLATTLAPFSIAFY